MVPLNAVYVRMRGLLDDLGTVSEGLYSKVIELDERLSGLGIAWEGTAYEQYSIRLKEDLDYMKAKALNMRIMHIVLQTSLKGYQQTELMVNNIIGGKRR